ncbi:MAG: presenilin family intramembrane aspartyl protease [Candidatus Micrarchaeota archaeon]
MKPLFTKTILIFLLVQIAALAIGAQFITNNVTAVENPQNTETPLYLFGIIVIFAIALLAVLKVYKGNLLFLFIELATLFIAVQLLLSTIIPEGFAILVAIAAIAVRLKWNETRQALLLITIAVVGALLGASLDIFPAALLAALLAGYDIVAVFYTKHMITLAKDLGNRGAAFSIKIFDKKEKLELGTGDIVIPAMLIVASEKIGTKIAFTSAPALIGIIGAALGLYVLLYILQKRKGYLPALPPITAGTLLGILIGTVLF